MNSKADVIAMSTERTPYPQAKSRWFGSVKRERLRLVFAFYSPDGNEIAMPIASMSAYLKRLNIDSVEESAEVPSAYLKRVEIVEVVDQNNNPWEPGPPPTEIGTVTVDPDNASVSVMGSATFNVVVTGGDATDLAYKWTVRSGNAQLDTPDNLASATYTFIREGPTQIQCSVSSATASNSPQTNLAFVVVS